MHDYMDAAAAIDGGSAACASAGWQLASPMSQAQWHALATTPWPMCQAAVWQHTGALMPAWLTLQLGSGVQLAQYTGATQPTLMLLCCLLRHNVCCGSSPCAAPTSCHAACVPAARSPARSVCQSHAEMCATSLPWQFLMTTSGWQWQRTWLGSGLRRCACMHACVLTV